MSENTCQHKIAFHSTVTIGSKWQIVIPKDAREVLDLQPWDKLVTITKWTIALWFIKSENIEEMMNYLKDEMDNTK